MTHDTYEPIAHELSRDPTRRYLVCCVRCEHAQELQRICELCSHEHTDADLATLLSPTHGARWEDAVVIPDHYLDWTLDEIIAVYGPGDGPPSEQPSIDDLRAAIRNLAACDARDRRWLAEQFGKLTTELEDPDTERAEAAEDEHEGRIA